MKKLLFVICFMALALVVAAGCGGGGDETVTETVAAETTETTDTTETETETETETNLVPVEALTPAGVEECLEQDDRATVVTSESLNPGEPIDAHGVFAVASDSGARIGIVLTLKPFITKRLSRELAEEGTYDISVTPDEDAMVVLDGKATPEDEALASECSEPQ